jgi:hypothetical protein
MAPKNDGGPAFPTDDYFDEKRYGVLSGMSLRDYFAAKAMQAEIITSCSDATPKAAEALVEAAFENGQTPQQRIAFNAYAFADAMLAERAK